MLHVRGNRRDFDLSPERLNISGFTYDKVLPYFKLSENATGLNLPYSTYHGYDGPLKIRYPIYFTNFQKQYLNAGIEFGNKNIDIDYNGRVQEDSISCPQLNMEGHIRQSAARAFLYSIKDRKNLHIIKNSFVVRILIENNMAVGVRYIRNGNICTIRARKDIIISAGAFNSPKLLMLSGIGPERELQKHGIPVILDLPVARKLIDQVGTSISFEINTNDTLTPDIWKTMDSINLYAKDKCGPLSSNGIDFIAFNGNEDSKEPPSLQFVGYNLRWKFDKFATKNIATIMITVTNPKSFGYMTIQSNDPFDPPIIDPKYLSHLEDFNVLKLGIKKVLKFLKTPTMLKYSPKIFTADQPECEGLSENSFVKCILLNYVVSHHRPVATTTIGSEDDPRAVINEKLHVLGIRNLKVISSSSLPYPLTGYTYAAGYALAEVGADLIRFDYLSAKLPEDPNILETIHKASHPLHEIVHLLIEHKKQFLASLLPI